MSFFKEAGDSLLRLSEKIVNKTELYAKIGKLVLDIKKIESDIHKIQKEIGEYVFNKFSDGSQPIDINDPTIVSKCERIRQHQEAIAQKRTEISELRKIEQERSSGQPGRNNEDIQNGGGQ